MATKRRKRYGAQFKFQVALDAAKGTETINELAAKHGLHPNQISLWKRLLLEEGRVVGVQLAAQAGAMAERIRCQAVRRAHKLERG